MTKKNSDNSDSCKPRRKPTVKQLRFAAAYVDPNAANGNGVAAARAAGYHGNARQLAVQAHANLKTQTVQQAIAEMVDALVVPALHRVGEATDAVKVRPFMTKNGTIVYAQPEPDHRTRIGAATFLFNLRSKCTPSPEIARLDRGDEGPTREEAIEAAKECLAGRGSIHHDDFLMASGEMTEAEFTDFLTHACMHLAAHTVDGAIHFVCMDWRHMGELLAAGKLAFSELKNVCVWAKDNGGLGSLYRSQHEFVFVYKSGKGPHRNNVQLGQFGRNRSNVWHYPGANTLSRSSEEGNLLKLHPTVKPAALVADAVMDCSGRGDIVLDSFLGSGTTVIACERTGRVCYGMELDPVYVDTTIRRWQAFTKKQATHAISGKAFDELDKEVASGVER